MEEKIKALQTQIQNRANQLIEADPVCRELKGMILAYQDVLKGDQPELTVKPQKESRMNALIGFVTERAKSLVSKKVAATAVGVGVVGAQDPQLAGWTLIAFIVVQGALDGWKYYIDVRWSE